MQHTTHTTAEELFFFYTPTHYSADADVAVTFDLTPPERATRNYPGNPGIVELLTWEVERYEIYDEEGNVVDYGPQARTPNKLLLEIDKWVNSNLQMLIDQTCEEVAELSDP